MKLHLFGASGTGVSTLGAALAEALGIPYLDSDTYFWEATDPPFTVRRAADARDARLAADLARHPHWILGGSLLGWGGDWRGAFDGAVFLWLPTALRLQRLRRRELLRYGSVIETDPVRCARHEAFMAWAAGYDDGSAGGHRTLANHERWLRELRCPVLELRQDWSVDERVAAVLGVIR